MTDDGYVNGQSDNLPQVDFFMAYAFLENDERFDTAEIRGAKESSQTKKILFPILDIEVMVKNIDNEYKTWTRSPMISPYASVVWNSDTNHKTTNVAEITRICFTCGLNISITDQKKDIFPKFHKDCLKCFNCKALLGNKKWCFVYKKTPYCDISCVRLKCLPKDSQCCGCQALLTGNSRVIKLQGRMYHSKCLRCAQCGKRMNPGFHYRMQNNKILCFKHVDRKNKKRTHITEKQRLGLMLQYKKCRYPNNLVLEEIGHKLNMNPATVKVWFQNRRARNKKKLSN